MLLEKYFPELSAKQKAQYKILQEALLEWNSKINLISRKDTEAFETNHLLHSLSLAKFKRFGRESKVLDLGTGGGFPGLPLAIYYPKCKFHLVDSIGKKIMVVKDLIDALGLENTTAEHTRVEILNGKYDYIVSRAVAPTKQLLDWTKHLKEKGQTEYLFLKGGDLTEELMEIGFKAKTQDIYPYYKDPFFETKKIVWIKA
ncbi:MAG: 16S rRNA (guanine(527)-N(7))-methyltransferase RsmG [Chitinophagales bacterium]|nr:16S rRNA (guanine(527)-N(7))-methyltransferase RsmG [Bacteroidota bacterium]MCB9256988.1 16S rRNA (guanine(527)-N(7))-methyltransferase RsmG [Chitinophagales bacterium]